MRDEALSRRKHVEEVSEPTKDPFSAVSVEECMAIWVEAERTYQQLADAFKAAEETRTLAFNRMRNVALGRKELA
jgi:hypothetical protein